jgi:hypothetical protein
MTTLRELKNIESALKRRITSSIKKQLTSELTKHGFIAGKFNFWVLEKTGFYWFVHLHTFTYAPAFRFHVGIRYMNDPFEAITLNGISTLNHSFETSGFFGSLKKSHYLSFDETSASQNLCVENMMLYFESIALPWLKEFNCLEDILRTKQLAYLKDVDITMIQQSLDKNDTLANILQTRKLFGLP